MIEVLIKKYLEENLKIKVFFENQKEKYEKFVIIEKVGSGKINYLNSSTFAFQSYANSFYEAAKLNDNLKKVLEKSIELERIAAVKLNSDYNFTDTDTKRPRYQAVYEIRYY